MIITSLTNTIHLNLRTCRIALDVVQLAHEVCTRPKGEVLIDINQSTKDLRPCRVALDAVQLAHEVCTRP